jgi:hypothetical protein
MRSPRLILLLLPALAIGGCAIGDDGPRTTDKRDVGAFTRIDNRDSVDVRLLVGRPQAVRVLAGEKVIDDVHTEVRDGTLEVTFDHDGLGGSNVVVEASVPELTGVVVDGSGNVEAAGIDADALEVRSDGSGDVALAGTAGRLTVVVDGSGDADHGDPAVTQRVDGSGELSRARG